MAKRIIPEKYRDCDFAGWATRNNIRCTDGRTIRSGAFAHQDGARVPLVWGHNHESPEFVIGHGYLENDPEGVFFYGYFNGNDLAKSARENVEHGDVTSLSIWANQLTQRAGDVLHGAIKEVSLVLSGANLGAQITYPVVVHGEDCEQLMDEAYITFGDKYGFIIKHSDMEFETTNSESAEEPIAEEELQHEDEFSEARSISNMDNIQEILHGLTPEQMDAVSYLVGKASEPILVHGGKDDDEDSADDKTVRDVLNTMTPEQRKVTAYLVSEAAVNGLDSEDDDDEVEHNDFGGDSMNFNAFESGIIAPAHFISHSDQMDILDVAKKYGNLKDALAAYAEEHGDVLSHDDLAPVSGFGSYPVDDAPAAVDALFPEFHDVRPGAPELVTNDLEWVKTVLGKVNRIPYNRIRTSQVDLREIEALRGKGYLKGKQKLLAGSYEKAKRETTPQTVYVRSTLNNDDIEDITDFSYVDFQYKIDRMMLEGEIARDILIGDGRDIGEPDKVKPDKIRPIWTDDDLYVIRKTLDISGTPNGTNTQANFGESYLYAQAVEELLLDAKIDYRGSGSMDMFCTQRFWNKMYLARDLNGRRLYNSKAELMSALDVNNVYPVYEFDNKTRTANGKTYRLLALVGNLRDYTVGSVRNGAIAHKSQFDIDFNQQKSLLETRMCGALTRIYSFIAIEEEVSANPSQG